MSDYLSNYYLLFDEADMTDNDKYLIMRSPCLMEDEGRHFYVKNFPTRREAREWIEAQKGEYFGPGSYYIAERSLYEDEP